jgi:preprotein translocase subunit SecG
LSVLFILTIVLSVLRKRKKDRQYNGQKKKDRQYNGQKEKDEGQTIQWSKGKGRRTDNTMVKRKTKKDRQYNDFRLLIASFIIIMYELYLQRNQISG